MQNIIQMPAQMYKKSTGRFFCCPSGPRTDMAAAAFPECLISEP